MGAFLYAGESVNLKARFSQIFGDPDVRAHWETLTEKPLSIRTCPTHAQPADALSWQCRLSAHFETRLNFHELRPLV